MDEHVQNPALAELETQKESQTPESAPIETKKTVESTKEYNLRILAERAEQAERKAAEYERLLREREQQRYEQNHAPQKEAYQSADEDDVDVADDDYLDGRRFKKTTKSLKQELAEVKQKLNEVYNSNASVSAEYRLKSQYSDFDNVVTKQNLATFARIYPEEYQTLMSSRDMYSMGKTAYTMLKNLGIADPEIAEQDKRLQENKNKPRAAASVGPQASDSPIARFGDYDRRVLTEERKEQLRRQVAEAKRYR